MFRDKQFWVLPDQRSPASLTLHTVDTACHPTSSSSWELPVAPRALQTWQHSPPLKSIKLQAFITSAGTVTYRSQLRMWHISHRSFALLSVGDPLGSKLAACVDHISANRETAAICKWSKRVLQVAAF